MNQTSEDNKTKNSTLEDEEKIDQIIKDITLKPPRNPYTQFVIVEKEAYKTKNKEKKLVLTNFNKDCATKWKNLSDNEKKPYIKLFEDEKTKYKNDLELVRHYLFKDINDSQVQRCPTAYRIFLNEKLREGFEKAYDPKEVKKDASAE